MTLFSIDPGPVESAFVVWDGAALLNFGKAGNHTVRALLNIFAFHNPSCPIICEKIACYGMAVGATVFQTCFWTGRYWEMAASFTPASPFHLVERLRVKMHLCHQAKAKDSNVRQALIDRFGEPGTKKAQGKLYGVSKDVWAALALAVTWYDQNQQPTAPCIETPQN